LVISTAKFTGWKPTPSSKENHYILNLNHDQGLLEIHLAYETFHALDVEKIFILTTKKAWKFFPKGNRPGEEVVYIEDEKPLDLLLQRVLSVTDKKIGILFCPEGQLPSMAGSTPITSKPGAFVFARKLAASLAAKNSNEKLLMVNGIFNAHQHFTSQQAVDLELNLSEPIVVPSQELTKDDAWIQEQRLQFENLANERRSLSFIDFIQPRRVSETNFFVSGPLKAYLPISQWFRGSIFTDCAARLRSLGQLRVE
jgi:hypothetical protein